MAEAIPPVLQDGVSHLKFMKFKGFTDKVYEQASKMTQCELDGVE